MTSTIATCFLFLLAMLPAPEGWPEEFRVLPDTYLIAHECEDAASEAAEYRPELTNYVATLCSDVKNGLISPEEWLLRIDPVARDIHNRDVCPQCLRLYLSKRLAIPAGFRAYVMFLVPAPRLEDAEWLLSFRNDFEHFGKSIGREYAAVWLGDRHGGPDEDHSKVYCDRFRLGYNDGPYVVVTNVRPDKFSDGDQAVIIKLNNIGPKRVLRVLNILEQDIRTQQGIRKRALLFEEIKQRVLTIAERYGDAFRDVVVGVFKSN